MSEPREHRGKSVGDQEIAAYSCLSGSFKGGWGLGPAMATWHALIAVVSVGIWARAVWKFARYVTFIVYRR